MTQNQIAYWNMMESKRHNEATEKIQQQDADTRSAEQVEKAENYDHSEWINEIRYDMDLWDMEYGPTAVRANAAAQDADTRQTQMESQTATNEVFGAINAATGIVDSVVGLFKPLGRMNSNAPSTTYGFPGY